MTIRTCPFCDEVWTVEDYDADWDRTGCPKCFADGTVPDVMCANCGEPTRPENAIIDDGNGKLFCDQMCADRYRSRYGFPSLYAVLNEQEELRVFAHGKDSGLRIVYGEDGGLVIKIDEEVRKR